LAIISVLGAMYPAVTVLLARVVLDETITRRQAAGLLAASAAIILVTLG
jgi:drug/metabolite transporter (DMT)-like permease